MDDLKKNTKVKNNVSESNVINVENPKFTNSNFINNNDSIIQNLDIIHKKINSKSLNKETKSEVKEIIKNQQNAYLNARKKNIFNYLNSKRFQNIIEINYPLNPEQNDKINSLNKINTNNYYKIYPIQINKN